MELTWPMKLRIAAAAAVGVLLIGILGWPMAEPFGRVAAMGSRDAIILLALAFVAGFIGYFVSWPYGREIGILAAPSGLAIWAARSGKMAGLIQLNPTVAERQALASSFRWEPFFWLAIVAAGFLGVLLARTLSPNKNRATQEESKPGPDKYAKTVIALVLSIVIAQFCIGIIAQDVKLDSVIGQPALAQVIFAVLVSFGAAAFVAKKFFNVSYIWPSISSAFVTAVMTSIYAKDIPYLAQTWPPVFFPNSVISVLPVQMVAFGTLGSVAGYWMAIRFDYWRKHEMN
jgi:zinc transporter ZupT